MDFFTESMETIVTKPFFSLLLFEDGCDSQEKNPPH